MTTDPSTIAAILAANATEPRYGTMECANCYHVGPCFDDGEAYICVDRAACQVRMVSSLRASNDAADIQNLMRENDACLVEIAQLKADNLHWRKLCDDAARGLVNASRDVERMEGDIAELRATNAGMSRSLDVCNESYLAATTERDALRADLASAHEHIGALTTGGVPTFAAGMMLRQLVRNGLIKGEYTLDEARICVEYFEQAAFGPTLADARTWLRRGEPKV